MTRVKFGSRCAGHKSKMHLCKYLFRNFMSCMPPKSMQHCVANGQGGVVPRVRETAVRLVQLFGCSFLWFSRAAVQN